MKRLLTLLLLTLGLTGCQNFTLSPEERARLIGIGIGAIERKVSK